MTYGDKLPSTHAQGYVFSLCGAKGDLRLQFAAPVDRAALIKDDIMACESAMYSASVVDKAISICILDDQCIGHPA